MKGIGNEEDGVEVRREEERRTKYCVQSSNNSWPLAISILFPIMATLHQNCMLDRSIDTPNQNSYLNTCVCVLGWGTVIRTCHTHCWKGQSQIPDRVKGHGGVSTIGAPE